MDSLLTRADYERIRHQINQQASERLKALEALYGGAIESPRASETVEPASARRKLKPIRRESSSSRRRFIAKGTIYANVVKVAPRTGLFNSQDIRTRLRERGFNPIPNDAGVFVAISKAAANGQFRLVAERQGTRGGRYEFVNPFPVVHGDHPNQEG